MKSAKVRFQNLCISLHWDRENLKSIHGSFTKYRRRDNVLSLYMIIHYEMDLARPGVLIIVTDIIKSTEIFTKYSSAELNN